jgi:hypothetical protein
MLLEAILPIASRHAAQPPPRDVVHGVVPIIAALGLGAIIGAIINLIGNSAAQRRRDARQDVGDRLQLQAMLSDLLAVVQYARDHGTFLMATWNARVARLVAKLQEQSTAPALRPVTYRQLLYGVSFQSPDARARITLVKPPDRLRMALALRG